MGVAPPRRAADSKRNAGPPCDVSDRRPPKTLNRPRNAPTACRRSHRQPASEPAPPKRRPSSGESPAQSVTRAKSRASVPRPEGHGAGCVRDALSSNAVEGVVRQMHAASQRRWTQVMQNLWRGNRASSRAAGAPLNAARPKVAHSHNLGASASHPRRALQPCRRRSSRSRRFARSWSSRLSSLSSSSRRASRRRR